MNKPFTYEHWEANDEYIILHGGPIGYTVSKHDAIIITNWLNSAYSDIISRSNLNVTRNKIDELKPIQSPYKLAYMRDYDYDYKDCEYYILGIIDKNGTFLDFYYKSEIEYELFSEWIPPFLAEASESVYEFSPSRHPELTAKEIFEKCGYIEIK